MDYTVLEKLMDQENLEPQKIWKFFGANTAEEMEKVIVDNLKSITMKPDDGFIYLAPDMIYRTSVENDHNVYYEKLMMVSFFLRGFAGYNNILPEAFTKAIGMIRFIFLVDTILKDNDSYVFFKESYLEFKRDRYFREQTSRMLELFDQIASEVENINLEETKQLLQEFKNTQNN